MVLVNFLKYYLFLPETDRKKTKYDLHKREKRNSLAHIMKDSKQ